MSEDEDSRPKFGRNSERLRRRIEETRSIRGHSLRCSECDRRSIGRASGWTLHLGDNEELYAFCPDCDER